jgi:ABC-type glycerol-3-phosphate transport system permease component
MTAKRFLKKNWVWLPAIVVIFIMVLPVWWIVSSSFTPPSELFSSPVRYFPSTPSIINYQSLFSDVHIGAAVFDTLVVSVITIFITNIFVLLAAYGFSHSRLKFVKLMYGFLLLSSFLPSMSTMIPLFQFFSKLRICDTYFVLIILYTSMLLPFSIIIITTFIQTIPRSLEEATTIDGGGQLTIIFRVLLPVMKSIITTMCIIDFVFCINEFMTPLIFTTSKINMLSVLLTMIPRVQYHVPWDQISALTAIMLAPMILFVVIFEKNIMSGLMAGSIKQ